MMMKNFNDFIVQLNEMYLFGEYEELTNEELDLLFLTLKIPLNSNGTNYIREAIFECYYYPDLQKKLKDIFTIIGQRHNKPNSAIRSSFRTALERLNMYRDTINCPIMQYFDIEENITPKDFLEIAVMYLHLQKERRNKFCKKPIPSFLVYAFSFNSLYPLHYIVYFHIVYWL